MRFFKSGKPKCQKCGQRDATNKDGLCDSCRYMVLLDNVVESRTQTVTA